MKRKLDETDHGFYEMPASKISPSAPPGYYGFQNPPTAASPMPTGIGHPMSASTPHSQTNSADGNIRRQQFMQSRISTAQYHQPHLSQSAESELRHVIDNFVNIYEQLDKNDDVDVKPNYSYTELAYLAMLRSPNFSLPIAQIYSYIQGRFKFFRNSTRKHWKNAVRHSLAKTMCFSKIAVGRGTSNNENLARSTYLWCILPNSISTFARGDYRATVDKETGTNTLRSAYFKMNAGQFWDRIGDYIAHKMAAFRTSVETTTTPGAIFESQICSVPNKHDPTKAQITQNRQAFKSVKNDALPPPYRPTQTTNACPPMTQQHFQPEVYNRHAQTPNRNISPLTTNTYPQMAPTNSCNVKNEQLPYQAYDTQQWNGSGFSDLGADPWLPKFPVQSPNSSCNGGMESGRCTPAFYQINPKQECSTPYSSYNQTDSGFETAESISPDTSCQFLNPCKFQDNVRDTASPILGDEQFDGQDLLDSVGDLETFELPPLCINDLSEFSDNFEVNQSQGQSQEHFTPQKQISNMASFPVSISQFIGAPQLISTPISSAPMMNNIPMYGYQPANYAYTSGGVPVSSVVGYTSDGRPVFAASMRPPKWNLNC